MAVIKRLRLKAVTSARQVRLDDGAARPPKGLPARDDLDDALDRTVRRLAEVQRVFYADGRYALLVVLQGRDASGKDGTIRRVFGGVNPMGCEVTSFKVPTEVETQHDFLWRIHQRVPPRGVFGIFNRSHYEDVVVPRVKSLVPRTVWSSRFEQINDFERTLSESGVIILKFFLHVSRDEQKRRLLDRLTDKTKNWKFRVGDLEDRALWSKYTAAYRDAIARCSTPWAPWHIVPADSKKARNVLIANTVVDALDGLRLRYPKPDPAIRNVKIE